MSVELLHREVSEKVIGAFFRVYNELGYGFLEKVYENSLAIALQEQHLRVRSQAPITVRFSGKVVGEYFADLLINENMIVEIKAATAIAPAHEAQLLNYLKATTIEVGLLLNFGPKPEFRRKAMTNRN